MKTDQRDRRLLGFAHFALILPALRETLQKRADAS
jgi:hypothetical protein